MMDGVGRFFPSTVYGLRPERIAFESGDQQTQSGCRPVFDKVYCSTASRHLTRHPLNWIWAIASCQIALQPDCPANQHQGRGPATDCPACSCNFDGFLVQNLL